MIPSVEARYKLMTPTVINFIQSCYKKDSILLSQFDLSTLDSAMVEKCTY